MGINVGFVGDIERGMWGFIGNVYNTVRKIHPKKLLPVSVTS